MTAPHPTAPLATEPELPRLDVDSVLFRTDPHAALQALRQQGRFAASRRGVEVLAHADVTALLKDDRLLTQDAHVYERYGAQQRLVSFARDGLLAAMQGEKHHRVRRAFLAAFRARAVEAQRDMMRETAETLVAGLPDAGPVEFVSAFTSPFPMQVLCRILGIPTQDIPAFSAAATQLHLLAQSPLEPGFTEIDRALHTLWDYCADLVQQRRLAPADDAISTLVAEQDTDERFTDAELVWNIANLIFAGQDTTRYQLASAVRSVLAEPGLWQRVADDPGSADQVAEEALRAEPVVNFVVRIPREDVEYDGVLLARGRRVILNVQAAARDPERFTDPEAFCPRKSGRHEESFDVPFGLGMHYCLGAGLARAELQEALVVLTRRLRDVRVVGEPVMTAPAGMLHGPEELHLDYRRRA